MYTLSLDEFGSFEDKDSTLTPFLIGGCIYDDSGDIHDRNEEKKRIKAYYSSVIDDVKKKKGAGGIFQTATYPRSLHVSDGSQNDLQRVAAVKSRIQETLGEFLQNGTYGGKDLKINGKKDAFERRKGEYRVYAVIKSADGKSLGLKEKAGTLLADGVASNLYVHMINEVLDRCVFNTPYAANGSHFSLNLATRVTKSLNRRDDSLPEYEALGYKGIEKNYNKEDITTEDGKPGMFFVLTNADVFRSMIIQKMTDDNPENVYLDELNVESILYDSKNSGKEFLYLADSICSVLTFRLAESGATQDDWLDEVNSRMDRLVPRDRQLLFGYDDADTDLSAVLRKYHVGDYYGALESINDASAKNSHFSDFYKERWFKYVEDRIIQDSEIETLKRAVNTLYFSQKTNRYSQSKGLYIGKILEQQAENVKSRISVKESRYVFFRLYECLMVAYCHMGDSVNAEKYYDKLSAYAYSATIEDYLRAQNMIVVLLMDSFRWKRALKIIKNSLAICKRYRSLKSQMSCDFNIGADSEVAKAESTLGQLFSFMGREDAEKCFNSALGYFEIKTADYYITQSYLLHHYLDAGLYDKYEHEAMSYFGGKKTDMERLEYIFAEGLKDDPIFNYKFALYVFIKGLYVRGSKSINMKCWNFLKNIEVEINSAYGDRLKKPFALIDHPCELICKYLMLIALERNDNKTAEKYRNLSAESIKDDNSPLLNAIVIKGELDRLRIGNKNRKEKDALVNAIYDMMVDMGSDVIMDKNIDLKTKEKAIDKYFRYTYN